MVLIGKEAYMYILSQLSKAQKKEMHKKEEKENLKIFHDLSMFFLDHIKYI